MADFLVGVFVGVVCVSIGAAGAYWLMARYESERMALYQELGRRQAQIDALQRESEIPVEEL